MGYFHWQAYANVLQLSLLLLYVNVVGLLC